MATQPSNPASEKTENGLKNVNIRVACPHCELVGVFSLERLQPKTRVRCQRCDQWFRIERGGKTEKVEAPDAAITVAVRGALSDWREHLAPESGRLESRSKRADGSWRRYVGRRTAIAAAVVLLAITGMAWRLVSGSASGARVAAFQEPEALADRAAMFSLAWVCRDAATMVRFTAPDESADFSNWRLRATGQLAAPLEDVQPREVKVESTAVAPEKDPSQAIVTVGFKVLTGAPPPKGAPGYSHRQAWSEIDGKWFFLPKETLKMLRSPRASPWK